MLRNHIIPKCQHFRRFSIRGVDTEEKSNDVRHSACLYAGSCFEILKKRKLLADKKKQKKEKKKQSSPTIPGYGGGKCTLLIQDVFKHLYVVPVIVKEMV